MKGTAITGVVISSVIFSVSIIILFLYLFKNSSSPTPAVIPSNKPLDGSFIFQFTIVDPDTFLSRTLKSKILLKDIELFLNPVVSNSISTQRSFTSPPDENLVIQNAQVCSVSIDTNTLNYNVNSADELDPHLYEIKNKYFLLDPFLTSGADMIITDTMKTEFNAVVKEKSKQTDYQYQDY